MLSGWASEPTPPTGRSSTAAHVPALSSQRVNATQGIPAARVASEGGGLSDDALGDPNALF